MYKDLFFIQAEVEYSPRNVSVTNKIMVTKLVTAPSSLEAIDKFKKYVRNMYRLSGDDYLNINLKCVTDCI